MPKAQDFDLEVFKVLNETEVKKASETARTSLFTPGTGKRFRLMGFTVSSNLETIVVLEDGTTEFFAILVAAKGNVSVSLPKSGYLSSTAANKLQLKVGETTVKLSGCFYGLEDIV